MRIIRFSILALTFFIFCVPDSNTYIQSTQNATERIIEASGVMSLDLTIGGVNSGLQNKYILSNARIMDVSGEGDILVLDERRVKVFDRNGEEKTIFGSPWDLGGNSAFFKSPADYLIVTEASSSYSTGPDYYHSTIRPQYNYILYAPDHTLIKRERIEDNPRYINYYAGSENQRRAIASGRISKMYALNETEMVFDIGYTDNSSDADYKYLKEILYDNSRRIAPLFQGRAHYSASSARSSYPLGTLHWEPLPGKRIVYVYDDEDTHSEEAGSYYTVHILSLNTLEDRQVKVPFEPIEYPESLTDPEKIRGSSASEKVRLAKLYSDSKYYPGIKRIKIDNNLIFLFRYTIEENIYIPTDIVDANTGELVNSVDFPAIPFVIKDEYGYRLIRGESGYRIIKKYKIDPAVYSKR